MTIRQFKISQSDKRIFRIIPLYITPPDGICSLLTLEVYSESRIDLTWVNGSTNEDGISIERSTDGINYTEIDTVGHGIQTYSNTGLSENTLYYYRVRAFRSISGLREYSPYSNVASDTTYFIYDYFVDSVAGDDGHLGTSDAEAWKTIAKVNGTVFPAGTNIGFKAGSEWRETLVIPSSGTVGNEINYGKYSNGDDPILNGGDIVGAFTADPDAWQTALNPGFQFGWTPGANVNVRNVIPANSAQVSGNKIRISIAATGFNATVDSVTIGVMTTGSIFDAPPTHITFDGGNNGCSILNGTTKVSDEVTFAFDKSKRHGIHIWCVQRQGLTYSPPAIGYLYWGQVTDQSETLNYAGTGATGLQLFDLFEVYGSVADLYDATITVICPNEVWKDGTLLTRGSSKYTLADQEWYNTAGTLHFKNVGGAPSGLFEATARNNCILNSVRRSNYTVSNKINIKYGTYKRFEDMWLEDLAVGFASEPTALITDDGNQIELFFKDAYFVSSDGVSFAIGGWTDIGAGYACEYVVKHNGVYYLFNTNSTPPAYQNIYLWTSVNRINWTYQGVVLTVGALGEWDHSLLGNTCVWVENGIWYMLYDGGNILLSPKYHVGLATANDPTGIWTKQGSVIDGILPGTDGAGIPDMVKVNNIPLKIGGYYYVYMSEYIPGGGDFNRKDIIWLAKSNDLYNWVNCGIIKDSRAIHDNTLYTYIDQAVTQFKGKSYFFNVVGNAPMGTHIDCGIDNRPFSELLLLTP